MEYELNKWYGWNGETDYPDTIHPFALVEVRYDFEKEVGHADQFRWIWIGHGDIFAFRIVKSSPRKPREWWVSEDVHCSGNMMYDYPAEGRIHVREVIEE